MSVCCGLAIIQSRMPSQDEYASLPKTSLPMAVGTSSNCEPAVCARNAGWIFTPGRTSILAVDDHRFAAQHLAVDRVEAS